jgi:hypothetical protein
VNPTSTTYFAGQRGRYDVGNVFDSVYTMVAKLEKRLLEPYSKG